MAPRSAALSVPFMLLFGTGTVVIQKIIFNMHAEGRQGSPNPHATTKDHKFEKPWFQTESMFIGMLLCLVVYEISRCLPSRRAKEEEAVKPPETAQLLSDASLPLQVPPQPTVIAPPAPSRTKQYLAVMFPAVCDLTATCLMNIGLVLIPASVWQMLRGSMVVFSLGLSYFILKKRYKIHHYVGVVLVVIALVIVAIAAMSGDTQPPSAAPSHHAHGAGSSTLTLIGILLVVGAQVVQALQIVIEEKLLKAIKLDPFLIVGLEGLWGALICSALLVPIAYIPATTHISRKFHEDTLDTFDMLGNNRSILAVVIVYVFAILGYNLFGMLVTLNYSAVLRTILEAVRTACIWVVNIFIFYVVDNRFGERVTGWSLLELAGFGTLMAGLFVYNGVIPLPAWCGPPPKHKLYVPIPEDTEDHPVIPATPVSVDQPGIAVVDQSEIISAQHEPPVSALSGQPMSGGLTLPGREVPIVEQAA